MRILKFFLYDWVGYNESISQWLHSSAALKPLMILFKSVIFKITTQPSYFRLFPVHFILLLLLFFIMLRNNRKNAVQQGAIYVKCLSLLLLNFLVTLMVVTAMKKFFHYPRPYCAHNFNMTTYLLAIFHYSQSVCTDTFPSSHTAYACLFIVSFWQILSRGLKAIGVFIMILVGISRVILGKQFIADVTYSYIIVLFVINPLNNLLVTKYFPKYRLITQRFLKKIF